MIDQTKVNEYFIQKWSKVTSKIPPYYSSHKRIASFISQDEWLLDVGCGRNDFKKYLKNVVGIDPVFDEADIKTTIENYIPDRLFDVATCLGSIGFGDENDISNQIQKVVECLKPKSRIFWRLTPKIKRKLLEVSAVEWTPDKLLKFANKHHYTQKNTMLDINNRLYAEWHRN